MHVIVKAVMETVVLQSRSREPGMVEAGAEGRYEYHSGAAR